jgi:uncharacterized membrane protein
LSGSLFAFAIFLVAGAEFVFIWDRMNTVFKFHMDAWLVLSLAAALVLPRLWNRWSAGGSQDKLWRACFVVLACGALFTSGSGLIAALRTERVAGPRPTLDGVAYLEGHSPFEAGAIDWLNRNVKGSPVMAEAHGASYGPYSRISMHTGLPTVLGWDYHVYQRGHTRREIERRKHDLELLYRADDRAAVLDVLRRHRIELVFFGDLERATYGAGGLEQSPGWRGLLMPVYRNPGVTIFAVEEP